MNPIKVLIVGCGHMGTSHALACHASPHFQITGVVARRKEFRDALLEKLGDSVAEIFSGGDFREALATVRPEAVCISTYPDTHAEFASLALQAGCHVFVEKPMATTVREAEALVVESLRLRRKLVVGYILQHHPAWSRFVEEARALGKPLVMRMNLNQQSSGNEWATHQAILQSMSPIVDCGVHYVDVMCRMAQSRPVSVHAMGVRLCDTLPKAMYNYGQMQIRFEDGSVGWYEAGWGPMMSQTAYFVKDVIGPKGSVSICASSETLSDSADVNAHTRTDSLVVHSGELDSGGAFRTRDSVIAMTDEPDHDALCAAEQAFFARAIREDLDLGGHLTSAVDSLNVVLAADESVRTGVVIRL